MRNLVACENHLSSVMSEAYQFGLWIQVDSAAPMPVPVQIRIPLLNIADACPTPANAYQ